MGGKGQLAPLLAGGLRRPSQEGPPRPGGGRGVAADAIWGPPLLLASPWSEKTGPVRASSPVRAPSQQRALPVERTAEHGSRARPLRAHWWGHGSPPAWPSAGLALGRGAVSAKDAAPFRHRPLGAPGGQQPRPAPSAESAPLPVFPWPHPSPRLTHTAAHKEPPNLQRVSVPTQAAPRDSQGPGTSKQAWQPVTSGGGPAGGDLGTAGRSAHRRPPALEAREPRL